MEGLGDKYSYVDDLAQEEEVEEEQEAEGLRKQNNRLARYHHLMTGNIPLSGEAAGGLSSRGMPERCKFWPNCKKGDTCPYYHPKTPCRSVLDASVVGRRGVKSFHVPQSQVVSELQVRQQVLLCSPSVQV